MIKRLLLIIPVLIVLFTSCEYPYSAHSEDYCCSAYHADGTWIGDAHNEYDCIDMLCYADDYCDCYCLE
ncbi:MAG: hypothetical protein AAF487_11235 [Bacteroidota bacterium]